MEIYADKGIKFVEQGSNITITKDREYKNKIFYNFKNGYFDLQIDNKVFKGFTFIRNEYDLIDIKHPTIQLSQDMKNFCYREAIRIKREIINFDEFYIGTTAMKVYNSIFNNSGELPILTFAKSGLRYYEQDKIIYCEQNPNKEDSRLAERAREGHKIINIYKNNNYLMRIEDGQIK